MQTAVAISINDQWSTPKDIKDVDISINVDRDGQPLYKVSGLNGIEQFALLLTANKEQALTTYNQIKEKILEIQLLEMLNKYS